MGIGGGSKTQTETAHTTGETAGASGSGTKYPAWTQQFQHDLADVALNLADGHVVRPDQLVAGLNPDQMRAFGLAGDTASQFGPGNNHTAQFNSMLSGATISPDAWKAHMNPYLDSVGRDAVNSMRREHDNAQAGLSARYAARGGLGGSGEGFARARMTRGLNEAVPGVISNIMSGGYDRAQGIAAQNAQMELANSGLFNNFLTSELDRQGSAAGLLGQAGERQYQQSQSEIDAPFDKLTWIRNNFAPAVLDTEQSGWQTGAQDQTVTSTKPDTSPGLFQQLLGLGGTLLTSDVKGGGTVGGNWLSGLLGNK